MSVLHSRSRERARLAFASRQRACTALNNKAAPDVIASRNVINNTVRQRCGLPRVKRTIEGARIISARLRANRVSCYRYESREMDVVWY